MITKVTKIILIFVTSLCLMMTILHELFHLSEPARKNFTFCPKKFQVFKIFWLLVIKNQGMTPDPNSTNSWIRFKPKSIRINNTVKKIQTWRLRREVHLHLLRPPVVRLVLQEKPLGTQPLSHRIRRRRQFTKIRRRQLASIAVAAADE